MSESFTLESIYENMCVLTEPVEPVASVIQEAMFNVDSVVVSTVDNSGMTRVRYRGTVMEDMSNDTRLTCRIDNTEDGIMIIEDTGNGDLRISIISGDNSVENFKVIKRFYQVNDIDGDLLIQKQERV